jgi:hypothetical protein
MAAGQAEVFAQRTTGVGLKYSKHELARIAAVAHSFLGRRMIMFQPTD